MLNVLCIYPGINKEVNDVAQLLIFLKKSGLDLSVITARSNRSKSVDTSPRYESMDGIGIYRLFDSFSEMVWFPDLLLRRTLSLARDLKPDLTFCSQELNMRIAVNLKKALRIPIVLLSEFVGDLAAGKSRSKKMSFLMQCLGVPYGSAYWEWLTKWSDAIITCDPQDRVDLITQSKWAIPVFYIPWCNQLPEDYSPASDRISGRGMYAGALSGFKNSKEFLETIPLIMEKTSTSEFIFLGGGDTSIIHLLREKYGSKIKYVRGMPRTKALELLSSCSFAYTPVKRGGWGFIGDCWATKTPLVMTHNEYCAKSSIDSLVVNRTEIDTGISRILTNNALCKTLQENGYLHYLREHTAAAVGKPIIEIMRRVLDHEDGPTRVQNNAS